MTTGSGITTTYGTAVPARSELRWSTPPADLVPSLPARRALAFLVWRAGLLRRARRLRVALVALSELREGILLGHAARDWLVWNSVTGIGVVTQLPTDPERLVRRLGLKAKGDGAVLRQALTVLIEDLYGERQA
jgi:hypothetical protein